MKTLYEIKEEYRAIIDELEMSETGELSEELISRLEIAETELQAKAVNYALVILDFAGRSAQIDEEVKRLQSLSKGYSNKAEYLKSRISEAMLTYGIEKIDGELVKLSFRKSEAVVITSETMIPEQYLIPQPPKIDKATIKQDLKAGAIILGAEIETRKNLQIK